MTDNLYDIVRSGKVFSEASENGLRLGVIPLQSFKLWDELTKELKSDVYFFSKYVQSFDSYSKGLGFAVLIESDKARYFEPFRVRKIDLEGFESYCDVSSEYGYAGPICTGDKAFANSALSALKAFFRKYNVVCAFVRYHPLLKNQEIVEGMRNTIPCNTTIYMDTSLPFEGILAGLNLKKRSNYRRALKKGTSVRCGTESDIAKFYDLYVQTMQHAHASDFYFLSEDFFRNTLQTLKDNSFMLVAEFEGDIVGASLFLFSEEMLHYHFSGKNLKNPNSAKANGTTVILCEAAKIASEKGIKKFHLGGGVGGASDDSLFNFKRDFSNLTATFYISKDVEIPSVYSDICAKLGIDTDKESFFPAYRTKI